MCGYPPVFVRRLRQGTVSHHWRNQQLRTDNLLLVNSDLLDYKDISSSTSYPSSQKLHCCGFGCFLSGSNHMKLQWARAHWWEAITQASKYSFTKKTSHLTSALNWEQIFSQLPVSVVFQWTKMLIHCQRGDISHMIGQHRLIKTWAQVADSFLQPLRGFPSACSSGNNKKSVSQI